MTLSLWAFVVGGSVRGANTELHDVRFAVAETAEAWIPSLKAQWWGEPRSLHLDAWGRLDWADGHRIEIVASDESVKDGPKLWLANMGGYVPGEFGEAHRNLFLVAHDATEAKARGLAACRDYRSPHRDYTHDVDSLIAVQDTLVERWRLRLVPDATKTAFVFETGYWPLKG